MEEEFRFAHHIRRLVSCRLRDFNRIHQFTPTIWAMETPALTINHALAGSQFMIGAGGLVVVTLSAYFGRLPFLFCFLTMTVATAAWCDAATNFESFLAARILYGFFSSIAQAGGLM